MAKVIVIVVAIIGLTTLGCTMFYSIQSSSDHETAIKAGYDQVWDPNAYRTLWKKCHHEQITESQ